MLITYSIGRDELIRTLWRRRAISREYVQLIAWFLVLAAASYALGWPDIAALTAIYAVLRPAFLYATLSQVVDANSTLTDSRTLEFTPAGIEAVGSDWRMAVPWRHFRGWSEDARNFYLQRGVTGLGPVIPKAAMNDQAQAELRQHLMALR